MFVALLRPLSKPSTQSLEAFSGPWKCKRTNVSPPLYPQAQPFGQLSGSDEDAAASFLAATDLSAGHEEESYARVIKYDDIDKTHEY